MYLVMYLYRQLPKFFFSTTNGKQVAIHRYKSKEFCLESKEPFSVQASYLKVVMHVLITIRKWNKSFKI